MAGRRRYDDGCAVAHALELIGERWALLVVRELVLGPKRFTDLRAGLPGVSADVLSQRLRELGDSGLVRKRKLAPPAGSWVYELTEWGAELQPIITGLGRWASRSPAMPYDASIGADSLVLSLEALFAPEAAGGFDATIGLRFGEQEFHVRVADREITLARGPAERADAVLEAGPDTVSELLTGRRTVEEAQRAGDLRINGDAEAVTRFLRLFRMPEPASME
ncbi:winged helix-turn-helix transcriptional regulator [Thermoactinospora rubra]|uniref:winged helix-turn-helix transcriptional regulator n=1 Tax=Thermoactinospora rubra TaxID=1088767 RepID=UPI00117E89E3|nr:winged helix-turn-helix transcriptional regulator [Thermoactinospora rubra]